MNPYEKLEALYATLPNIKCERKCGQYCGPVLLSKMEVTRLGEKRGWVETVPSFEVAERLYLPTPKAIQHAYIGMKPTDQLRCVFFEPVFQKCTCYSIRPLVCRLWGLMDNQFMRCPHGCVPDRWVTDEESRQLHLQVIAIQKEYDDGRVAD